MSVQTVWITGASTGIGRELALLYAQRGCRVLASARSIEKLEQLATEANSLPGNVIAHPLDVTDENAVRVLVEKLLSSDYLPDLTVLNAGFYNPLRFEELTTAHFEQTLAVNYMGVVRCLMALKPGLVTRGSGHIAVVASVAGYTGLPNAAAYGSSKAALINLCESLKHDFDKHGLVISVVNPGFVKTPMTDKNEFAMPFLISPEKAAERIASGLDRRSFEVSFPRRFTWLLKLLGFLPYRVFFALTGKLAQ